MNDPTNESGVRKSASAGRATSTTLKLKSLAEIFSQPPNEHAWLVAERLPLPGSSLLVASPKVGKSTIARGLALAVATGTSFLGYETKQGPVVYLAFEENEHEMHRHFSQMGATGDEPIFVHAAGAPSDALAAVIEIVTTHKPVLIIVDTLFRLIATRDANDYAALVQALAPFTDAARELGFHVCFVHHARKDSRGGAAESILGSTGILGAVDTAMFLKRTGKFRRFETVQRYGPSVEGIELELSEYGVMEIVGTVSRSQDDESRILSLFSNAEPLTEAQLLERAHMRKDKLQRTLRKLVEQTKLARTGSGKKGSPFEYHLPFQAPPQTHANAEVAK